MVTAEIIAEGATLKNRITSDTKRLKELEAELVKLPPGSHSGENGTKCQVIAPSASIKLDPKLADQVKEITGADTFGKLFEKVPTYKAVKAFREILGAICGKREAKKVLAITEQAATPYVKW